MAAVCALGYNQIICMLQHEAYQHAVTLATALLQLLPALEGLPGATMAEGQQARVLMLAQQALLDLHLKQTPRWEVVALLLPTTTPRYGYCHGFALAVGRRWCWQPDCRQS